MALFRHPHLVRGVVHTTYGSFAINRGIVDVAEELGESYGWQLLQREDLANGPISRSHALSERRWEMNTSAVWESRRVPFATHENNRQDR